MRLLMALLAGALLSCSREPFPSSRLDTTWKHLPNGDWQEVPNAPAPPPAPPPAKPEIGRYRISGTGATAVLLDTVTGDTWARCTIAEDPRIWGAWCSMDLRHFAAIERARAKQ